MRDISPAENCSAEEFLERSPASVRAVAQKIRAEKRTGLRLKPSTSLLDESRVLGADKRRFLLDRVTALVDENLFGRAEMCQQFANLLARSLAELGLLARPMMGEATYLDTVGRELFRWQHAWVRIGDEVVDGNVDALYENPMVPASVSVRPYWGHIRNTPADRRLRASSLLRFPSDGDVEKIWWPELRDWLHTHLM